MKESPVLMIYLESISPAEDTLSDRFINSNQLEDPMYQLTIEASPALHALKAETDAEAER